MKRMALGVVCASALACGGPAIGDDKEPAKLFESLDKNSDGTLAADEVGEDQKRFYERLVRVGDKNEDKKLSRDEFVAAMTAEEKPVETPRQFGPGRGDRPMFAPGQMFDRMDRDKDGKFAKSEIPEQMPAEMRERMELVFTAAGKSEVTKEEFEKVMEKYGPPRGPEGRRPDGPRPDSDEDRPRPPRDGERPRPEGDRREMAREGDRGPGPGRDGDRPRPDGERREMAREGDRGPGPGREGDRREMTREGDRPEGRGFGGSPFGGRPVSPLIRVLDRDENGKLNRRELARLSERFDELDRNEDGELDPQEILGVPFGSGFSPFGGRPGFGQGFGPDRGREMAREGERRPEGPRDGDRRPEGARDGDRPRPEGARDGGPRPDGRPGDRADGRPGDRPEGRPGFGPSGGGPGRDGGRPGDFFARLDKDGDGSLSKEEAPERMKERFKELDRNGDGKITAEEFREAIAKEFGVPGERRDRRPEQEN